MTVANDDEDVHSAGMQLLKALVQDGMLNSPLCAESGFYFSKVRLKRPSS
jgi:hypothetical protein